MNTLGWGLFLSKSAQACVCKTAVLFTLSWELRGAVEFTEVNNTAKCILNTPSPYSPV